jgi:nitroreductase
MEYTLLVNGRESIRDYDPNKPVSKETLQNILDAGRMAPSAKNLQPWKFLVIKSPEMLGKIRTCYGRDWFKMAPVVLVVVGYKDKAWVRSYDGYNSIETDVSIVMTHLVLAAENEGVGTCWIEAYDPAILREVLHLSDNEVVFGITPLGYPHDGFTKRGNKLRKSLEEVVEFL